MLSHRLFLVGAAGRLFGADQALVEKLGKRIVHQAHPLFATGLDDAGEHEGLRFANDVRDRRRVRQDFEREDAALAIDPRNELLANHAAQRFADHDADLVLLIDRENIEQTVERAGGVAGVECTRGQGDRSPKR